MSDKPDSATAPWLRYLPKLLSCSMQELHNLELAALGRAANHLRTARLEWEEAAAQKEVAGVARWLIETRDLLLESASRTVEMKAEGEFPGEVVTITANKQGLVLGTITHPPTFILGADVDDLDQRFELAAFKVHRLLGLAESVRHDEIEMLRAPLLGATNGDLPEVPPCRFA